MLDRIIQEMLASFASWKVDKGLITADNPTPIPPQRVTQSAPATPMKRATPSELASTTPYGQMVPKGGNLEDPEYFQRLLQSHYPEHMLHCPRTSLYPVFFFFMERWEQRKALRKAAAAGNDE